MSRHDGDGGALTFPHAAPPPPGTAIEVAPGIRWLRMPLPFALDHINLWLVADGEGWAIVDTGLGNDATKALWEQILATALDGRPITRVIVTHFHPDHMGLAGWLTERLGVELWATEAEWALARRLTTATAGELQPKVVDFYRITGLKEDPGTIFSGGGDHYRKRVSPVPAQYRRLSDGMEFAIGAHSWRVIIGRGHAPEHACLHCPALDVLIAGDQVLPKISPNISVSPQEPEEDPLGRYLDSLHKLRHAVPDTALALPSHNLPFYGLHERIAQLIAHHVERLAVVAKACDVPRNACEVMPFLFRRALDPHQLGFAVGETLAHMQHATRTGHLVRTEEDGVWLFRRAG